MCPQPTPRAASRWTAHLRHSYPHGWPAVAELAGHAGVFDYVEFVGEYAPYDLFALENLARAVEAFPHMTAMMKIEQQPRTYLAVRAIGSGIQNLLFADPRTVDDVRECVRACGRRRPPPAASMGWACVATWVTWWTWARPPSCRPWRTRWWR